MPNTNNTSEDFGLDIDNLMQEIGRYLPNFNERKFLKAYKFAKNAHDGQLRKGGQPYITHPLETAKILKTMHVDEDTLIAALLHDVPEDTSKSLDDVQEKFGKRVAFLVDGITKLSKVHYQHDMERRQIESLRKLFMHTAKDPRIILIKLADRLHNMRTLQHVDKQEKRSRIARETIEIFVPIASLLGIEEVKTELEDLCFRHLYPDEYSLINDRMKLNREKNHEILDESIALIEAAFKENNLEASVIGRRKNLYSIYKRVTNEVNRIQDFDNFIALRILVKGKEECYKALGVIHEIFKPKPGKFKDYVAVPKKNGYQSLHTTVFGLRGITTELQIRTHQMHLEAEYGIASNYFENTKVRAQLATDERARWVSKIINYDNQLDEEANFVENLKTDLFHDRIFAFTPKGESIDLPLGATCIDFAYEIHTEVGHRAIQAEINGQTKPLTSKLQTGDTVNIITSDIPKGPNRSWLAFIKTNAAKNGILNYFKKISKEEKIRTGHLLLQKEMDRAGVGNMNNIPKKKVRLFCEHHKNCANLNDVLIRIGEGTLSPLDFVNEVYPDKERSLLHLDKLWRLAFRGNRKKAKIVNVKIYCKDSLKLKKILNVLYEQNLNSVKTKAYYGFNNSVYVCKLWIKVQNFSEISRLFESLEQVDGIIKIKRLFWQRKLHFIIGSILTFALWAMHPYILHYITTEKAFTERYPFGSNGLLYLGVIMLFVTVILMRRITQRSFPELRETSTFWTIIFLITSFALLTLFAEIYFFEIDVDWYAIMGLVLIYVVFLVSEYLNYAKLK